MLVTLERVKRVIESNKDSIATLQNDETRKGFKKQGKALFGIKPV